MQPDSEATAYKLFFSPKQRELVKPPCLVHVSVHKNRSIYVTATMQGVIIDKYLLRFRC